MFEIIENNSTQNNIINQIDNLKNKYGRAPEIFGGAIHAYQYVESKDFNSFCRYLDAVITASKYFNWEDGIADALRIFCHLCRADPGLIEAHIGVRFKDIEKIFK